MASIYRIGSNWRAQVRLKDKPPISKVFPSKRDAQIWAREKEEGLFKSPSHDPMMTFADVMAKYKEHARPGGKSKQYTLARLNKYWGAWRMAEINSGAISDFAKKRRDEGAAPSTVLADLSYLSTVLGHGGVLAGNREAQIARMELKAATASLRHTGTVADSEERDRRPTDDELRRLIHFFCSRTKVPLPMADIVLFAIATCMRQGEIVGPGGIKWEDHRPNQKSIWVRGRKHPKKPGGRDDLVPLVKGHVTFEGNIIDPVAIMERQASAYLRKGVIFPFREQRVCDAFSNACEILRIDDLRFHDLRHDGISRLFEAGYDIPQVSMISGHRSWKNLRRYTHLRPSTIKQVSLS